MRDDLLCVCNGVIPGMPAPCENPMTQEDMLCDGCREMCHGPLGDARRAEFKRAQEYIEQALGRPMTQPFFPDEQG